MCEHCLEGKQTRVSFNIMIVQESWYIFEMIYPK
jgi:hypothetical protein